MAEHVNGDATTVPPWMTPILRGFQAVTSRLGLSHRLGSTHDGLREMEAIFGYKNRLTYADFKHVYGRGGLGQRVVTIWPEATWSQPPRVHNDPEAADPTPFEQDWDAFTARIGLYRRLAHADMLAQLGHYAGVLVGLRGQDLLSQPAIPVRSLDDLLFLQPYSEELLQIETFGTNASQPEYGKPLTYRLLQGTSQDTADVGLRRPPRAGVVIHASRVLHVPGQRGLDDPDIYGVPILEAIYNTLVDQMKAVGGGSEMFYRDAKGRLVAEARDGFSLSADDREFLDQEAAEWQHGMRDFLRVMGLDVKQLGGIVADPSNHFTVGMQIICGTIGVPMRIVLGTERGSLASSQDENAFLRGVTDRQVNYAEPLLLRPFLDKVLALVPSLPPQPDLTVEWPNLWSLSEIQQAEVMKNRAQAVQAVLAAAATYTGPGLVGTLLAPEEVRGLMATVWQVSELELTPELPPEVLAEQQLLLTMPSGGDGLSPQDGTPADTAPGDTAPTEPPAVGGTS
jgi:uncharacterized protein